MSYDTHPAFFVRIAIALNLHYFIRRREKHAALVIERFFTTIKAEIDREIKHLERKQKKRGKRNLKCDTGVVDSSHRSSVEPSKMAGHHGFAPPRVDSFDYSRRPSNDGSSRFMTHQAQHYSHVPKDFGSTTSYSNVPDQHQFESHNSGRKGIPDYQSRCMNASGYTGQQSVASQQGSYSASQNGYSQRSTGKVPSCSDESSVQSIELTQTLSETEARLAKLQSEVAGLVSRYQVAEDELQTVGNSIDRSHSSYSSRSSQENNRGELQFSGGHGVTPPRAPLQQRLNHLDVTPPRLSYSQHGRMPTQHDGSPSCVPRQPHHQGTHSLHVPVPMRYTNSSPHLQSGRVSPQMPSHGCMNYQDQRFPPIPSSSQSNIGVTHNLSNISADSNSFIGPYGTSHNNSGPPPLPLQAPQQMSMHYPYQGQSPMNYYNSPSYHQLNQHNQRPNHPTHHYGAPRTPSGRQF